MEETQKNNPLHGKTLEIIVNALVEEYDWDGLGARIDIRCFKNNPSVKSSLKFLRKTPWAREKVEQLYIETFFPAQNLYRVKSKLKLKPKSQPKPK